MVDRFDEWHTFTTLSMARIDATMDKTDNTNHGVSTMMMLQNMRGLMSNMGVLLEVW